MTALRTPQLMARLATTLAAWLAAFTVVTTLLTLFGDQLGALPLGLRALVISGTLVALMVNLVMPAISVAVSRLVLPERRSPGGRA
jgi:antibiotic biosynthesis monooxygenase (ABM) superfamily enzyme